MSITIEQLNAADAAGFVQLLDGLYEHTDWVTERAAAQRPFVSAAALLQALWTCVAQASEAEQLALIRAHPELGMARAPAAQASTGGTPAAGETELTAASAYEQRLAGLRAAELSDEVSEGLRHENAAYRERFGFPFILAVRGADGAGMAPPAILATLRRRLPRTASQEREEALRQINRIAEMRLQRLLDADAAHGRRVLRWCDELAAHSEDENGLTCTYLSEAHLACARDLLGWMRAAGLAAHIDAFGNVVGRYASAVRGARTLLAGSHYDTVRNAGKYAGRAGVLLALSVVAGFKAQARPLPFHVEAVAFADKEGVRFGTPLLGSRALTGRLDDDLWSRRDVHGVCLADLLSERRRAFDAANAQGRTSDCGEPAAAQAPREPLAFLEMDIEQGAHLFAAQLPLGIATRIASGDAVPEPGHADETLDMQAACARAVRELGLPDRYFAPAALHDAAEMSRIAPAGMLLIRCGNGGASRGPLESVTAEDLEWAAQAFERIVSALAETEWARFEAHR